MDCSRRDFFSRLGRSVLNDIGHSVSAVRTEVFKHVIPGSGFAFDPEPTPSRKPVRAWFRPLGALPEAQFLSTCTRCTDCCEACPHHAIRRLGPEFGAAAGTPAIIASESPCYLCEDMPCIACCEPGALLPIKPRDVRMGTATIRLDDCYKTSGQPCDYCVVRCPIGSDAIRFDGKGVPVVSETGCTGCGVCVYLCPADAIDIDPHVG